MFFSAWQKCSLPMRWALQATNYQIVFTTDRNGVEEFYIMNADGSHQQRFTSNDSISPTPTPMTLNNFYEENIPSPDGQYLASMAQDTTAPQNFERAIWVANADGTENHRVTDTITYISGYSWSPDSQRIAYPGSGWLFVTDVDGSSTRQLTERWSWLVGVPSWSPDGKYLVFDSVQNRDGFDYDMEIIVVDVESAERCILTSSYEYLDRDPTWVGH